MLNTILDVVLWLLALEILTLAALPLAMRVLYGLPDGGYATSKILALLLIGYAGWITGIAGVSAFTGPTLVVFTLILGAVSWWLWGGTVRAAWPTIRPLAIGAEATFILVFLVACGVRAWNAPIAGQEKAMDFTFMYSLIRADTLPAEDLWLGGFAMPYYYLGYLIQSLIAKVLPIDPSVSYNLAVAMVLALAATGAFGLVASLIKLAGGSARMSILFGGIGAFGLTIMGNLQAMFELIAGQNIGDAATWAAIGIKNLTANTGGFPPQDGGWWFRAARVIPNIQPDGIDEFPYFSFLLGDLHPHYMAIPLAVMIVAFASHELLSGRALRSDPLRLAVCGIVLGAVIPFNTWDVPVFWGLFALAMFASALRSPTPQAAFIDRVKDLAWVVAIAVVCYSPYFIGYVSQQLGLGITEERTMFGSLFVLFGPLLVLALAGGAIALVAAPAPVEGGPPLAVIALGAGTGIALVLVALGQPTLGALVAGIIFWSVLIFLRIRGGAPSAAVATGLITLAGLGSILVPELIYLRDLFGSRMNTVFKFYYDAWILLALAAPLIAYEMVVAVRDASSQVRAAARPLAAATLAFSALLMLGGTLYPVFATMTKSSYGTGPSLDGMAHLRRFRGEDAAAIDWLRRARATGGIVEAVGDDYTDAGRYSTFAGMPTLVGWPGHQVQWRGSLPAIEERRQLARRVYSTTDVSLLQGELKSAGMRYIVVGGMERELYGPTAGVGIEQSLPVVQQFGNTRIYELPDWSR